MAYMFKRYYCWGICESFRGYYDSFEEALDALKGDRYELQLLELHNTETGEWARYEWEPTYDIKNLDNHPDLRDGDANSLTMSKVRVELTLRHTHGIPEALHKIETNEWQLNRANGAYYHLEQAGSWTHEKD